MLTIKDLSVNVDWKNILKNINLTFDVGKNYCILWKNGSWKSSLAMSVMWNPKYEITAGDIQIDKISLKKIDPHARAKLWIFLAFQHIPEIPWVKVFEFLRSIYDAKNDSQTSFLQFKKIIEPMISELWIDKDFLRRDLNVGFSGGERRKLEILQLRLLEPKYIFLDEIDSWLDVDAFKSVAKLVAKLNHEKNTFIIITHLFDILDHLPIDEVCVIEKWEIIKKRNEVKSRTSAKDWSRSGGRVKKIIKKIKSDWFENI